MSNFPHGSPHDEMMMSAFDQYAPAHYAEYPPPEPYATAGGGGGGGFTLEQAQWLIQFMRNLPGGQPPEPTDDEYSQSFAAQRAHAETLPSPEPWNYDENY